MPWLRAMTENLEQRSALNQFSAEDLQSGVVAGKLNAMRGPLRFLIPEGGVSAIDKPGQPFHDPEADRVLFSTIEQRFRPGPDRKLIRLPLESLRVIGRGSAGVRLFNVADQEHVVSAVRLADDGDDAGGAPAIDGDTVH